MADGSTKSTESAKAHNNDALPAVRWGTITNKTGITSSATTVATVGTNTNMVRLCVQSAPVFVGIGSAQISAAASGVFVPVGVPEYVVVSPGDVISAIEGGTESGSLYVAEC